jgi:hypothetical protein
MAASDLFSLANLADQVCNNLGATDNLTQTKARKYINRALIRFSELGEWSWQRVYSQPFPSAGAPVTVSGQTVYGVPNCLRLESLYASSPIQRRLKLLDDRQFRRMYPNDTAIGFPYFYRHMGRRNAGIAVDTLQIGLYPIPDAAYTILWDGVREITLMVNDTDDVRVLTGMPVTMVDILIEMATAIGWKEIDDSDAASQMQEVMIRLKGLYGKDQHDIEDVNIMAPFDSDDLNRYNDPQLDPRFS